MGFYIGWNEEDLIMARAGRIVAAKDENGREYIYQSVNSAVPEFNISLPPTHSHKEICKERWNRDDPLRYGED